ncbi:MAG: DNA repair ATPase [Deltaproteobacteria bacterium]
MVDVNAKEEATLEGGSYEVIRRRLLEQAAALGEAAERLNAKRVGTFGGTELAVIGNERVRTENNCVPRDIVNVGGTLLFGYNVFLGLKTETSIDDVFSLHGFTEKDGGGFDLSALPLDSGGGLLSGEEFQRDFAELYKYYKDARLLVVREAEGRLLAVFQTGNTLADIKAFRWAVDKGAPRYIDNRAEKDHTFPPSHDFEWVQTSRDDHVSGRHPHVNILDEVFVETVGGDLTVKVENNTEDGKGIYREPVDDPRQALDDGEIHYAKVGALILLKILPYREETWRYLVFNTRTQQVKRIDAIGQSCVQLPEDHGVVFPGGYYLQTGSSKIFDAEIEDLVFMRSIRAPNGEDVLYVFYHQIDGQYLLLPYNLIRKEVPNPIVCHGFTLFDDGKMLVFRSTSDEPTRVHPMQVWQTPFTSDEFAAKAPTDGSYLAKIGNAELVRGISDAFSVQRLIETDEPTRLTYEDLIASAVRLVDNYYWLGHEESEGLAQILGTIRENAELIVDEFEKVLALKKQAEEALAEAVEQQKDIFRELRPEDWREVKAFLFAMNSLRTQRGHLITLRDVRYIDVEALEGMEAEVVEQFDRVSKYCVEFMLTGEALGPLIAQIDELEAKVGEVEKGTEFAPLVEDLEGLSKGLELLSEVVSGLQIDDATQRTQILESISEVFGHLNRARATLTSKKKSMLSAEGRAEFGAQFKLLGQAVASSLAMADSPDKCDEQLSRLMVQLEDLEARFSEFDEFLADLAAKREEIYEAFGGKKQQLLDERNRRATNLATAADRILSGVARRVKSFKADDELNAYFASDAMVMKLRQLVEQLRALGDSVKADDVEARVKSAKQDAVRNLRDKIDLFAEGDDIISFGQHKFTVNTQSFELTMVPRGDQMALHLTGTDFYETITDEAFAKTREFWDQHLVSETKDVYRGEYLAASMLFDAEVGNKGLSIEKLVEASHDTTSLVELVRTYAADRYEEGYERGLHDADTAKILEKLLSIWQSAGLLRFAPRPRALACLFWAFYGDEAQRRMLHRRSMSMARLAKAFSHPRAAQALADDAAKLMTAFFEAHAVVAEPADVQTAARYLAEELGVEQPRFSTSQEATKLEKAFVSYLDVSGTRPAFEEDLETLTSDLAERFELAEAWIEAFLDASEKVQDLRPAIPEAAALFLTERELDREPSAALTKASVEGLLGQHPRILDQTMQLRIDEFLGRLTEFVNVRVPAYEGFRRVRHALLERERERLRLDEFTPRVLTSFVRNKLINDVYLPMIGDNLAKQLGAAGEKKRTDLMGLLLLISPPGYGKTTLMEYLASRLGMVFMKVNGPSLGYDVTSLDPNDAPNATARQEVEKINLAFEMANNVMLYLDDIQHTNPELLQKFISLCDAQRRIEGVWKGRTRTYDLRGKKFAVVMAGNPYTESGEKFQIPDMLANRADTYNLGDILDGREEVFALSYIENALTSNAALAPIAARSLPDVHLFIKLAQGKEVPQTAFAHSYAAVQIEEIKGTLQRLFEVQRTLLAVNQEYIASASQDDRFRTEPRFQLQGSYRNMNKLAEKVVPAMNAEELEALVTDHYAGESQTLTSGAEANILKLAELRDVMTEAQAARWELIKKEFRRLQVSGAADDDPVSRVTSTLGALGEQLDGIRTQLAAAVENRGDDWVGQHVSRLDEAVKALATPQSVQVDLAPPEALAQVLTQQLAALEQTLLPLVRASAQNQDEIRAIKAPLVELIELLKINALTPGNGAPAKKPAKKKRASASGAESPKA